MKNSILLKRSFYSYAAFDPISFFPWQEIWSAQEAEGHVSRALYYAISYSRPKPSCYWLHPSKHPLTFSGTTSTIFWFYLPRTNRATSLQEIQQLFALPLPLKLKVGKDAMKRQIQVSLKHLLKLCLTFKMTGNQTRRESNEEATHVLQRTL